MLVKDFLGKKSKKGHQGLELEVESSDELPIIKDDFWTTKADGTLMGSNGRPGFGAEYVSNGPQDISITGKAIRSLCWELGQKKYKVLPESPRTSFHVHNNVLGHTPIQYWTGATLYWLVEPLLFDFCAPRRKANAFCLRLQDAEGILLYVFEDLRASQPFTKLGTDQIRYAGQNLAATALHGTIEARGMDGRIDAARQELWSKALYAIYGEAAKSYDSPSTLLQEYETLPAHEFLLKNFGAEFTQQITVDKEWREKLLESAANVSELAYFHDWSKWYATIQANVKKNGLTKNLYGLDEEGEPPIRPVRRAPRPLERALLHTDTPVQVTIGTTPTTWFGDSTE